MQPYSSGVKSVTPTILAAALSLGGCDLLTPEDAVFSRDTFKRLVCQDGLGAEEAVDSLRSAPQTDGLVVEAHEIISGAQGTVVTIDNRGDHSALKFVLIFADGANNVEVSATKAGQPISDDFTLLDEVVTAAGLKNCSPAV